MSSILIRGASITGFWAETNNEGKVAVIINMVADWTKNLADEMKWTEEPSGFGRGALTNKLIGRTMILEPNGAKLKDYRMDLSIGLVNQFKHVPVVKDGNVVSRKVEFQVHAIAEDSQLYLSLFNWQSNVGPSDSKAQCKISFSDKEKDQMKLGDDGKQATIPGTEAEPIDKPRGRKRDTETVQ